MEDQRDIESLIEALARPEERDPAYFLGELGDPRAVEPLKAAYTAALVGGDPHKAVAPFFADSYGTARDRIIQALAKMGDHRATETGRAFRFVRSRRDHRRLRGIKELQTPHWPTRGSEKSPRESGDRSGKSNRWIAERKQVGIVL